MVSTERLEYLGGTTDLLAALEYLIERHALMQI